MTTAVTTSAVTEARDKLSEIIDTVVSTGAEWVITKHGRPAAVILSYDEYESLIETVNILSDRSATDAITDALADVAADDLEELE